MNSIRELYRIGNGPSSSHTMGPRRAADLFIQRVPVADSYRVTLFGSLALTGKGHLTDRTLEEAFQPCALEICWKPDEQMPLHPNGLLFEALDESGEVVSAWRCYSVGGGALTDENGVSLDAANVRYHLSSMNAILEFCEENGYTFWEFVEMHEGEGIWDFLRQVWQAMGAAIERGLGADGRLPGSLGVSRKAWVFNRKAQTAGKHFGDAGRLASYALAVSEENASGGVVVTAPTCGSSGVLPAVLRFTQEMVQCNEMTILRALATAGLIGVLVKHNASISGAEVGCQGEVGTACAMAAAAAGQILGATVRQIEYAAEMGLEHHLGLTCDPVGGLVQIPCIERNAFAADRALACSDFALFSDGVHRISLDAVIAVMRDTGKDLSARYRETALGGLASVYRQKT